MASEYDIFNSSWSVYRKVVDMDHMKHRHFSNQTGYWMEKMRVSLQVLDLGCGDGLEIARVLRSAEVNSFTGCDMSGPALELAKKNLSRIPGVTLLQESMEALLQREVSRFNLIHSSFAIHHLQDEVKRELLERIHALLEPGGLFLLVDVFRLPGQSRPEYLSRYVRMLREDWGGLSEVEKDLIEDHLTRFDFPAEEDWLLSAAAEIGFTLQETTAPDEHHRMMVFEKSTVPTLA